MNKKGWVILVEVAIALMILFGLFLGLMQKQTEKPDIAKQVYKIQHQILTEAQDNYCIRNDLLSVNETSLKKFIAKRLCRMPYNFTVRLCNMTDTCLFPGQEPDTDIYADNIIIAANLTTYNPVKIAFFAWQGSTQCEDYECVKPWEAANCNNNGIKEEGELCDGNDLAGQSCASLIGSGWTGNPKCTDKCEFDWSVCSAPTGPTPTPGCTPSAEVCDGADNNCNGVADDGLTFDADNDGYSTPSSCGGTKNDCNDGNAAVNPGAAESGPECNDGVDNNCNGPIDGDEPGC